MRRIPLVGFYYFHRKHSSVIECGKPKEKNCDARFRDQFIHPPLTGNTHVAGTNVCPPSIFCIYVRIPISLTILFSHTKSVKLNIVKFKRHEHFRKSNKNIYSSFDCYSLHMETAMLSPIAVIAAKTKIV